MVTSITGIAKAIQEAKVSPVASPNLWIRVSGTTRFGGEPEQAIMDFEFFQQKCFSLLHISVQ